MSSGIEIPISWTAIKVADTRPSDPLSMCGIAGVVRLAGREPLPSAILKRMADALAHRGPDAEGYVEWDGVGFASRRLKVIGLDDGHQPSFNPDQSVAAVFNGELFEYRALKRRLEQEGHRFATQCDSELIPHLWDDHQERMLDLTQGQFAFALYDRRRHRLMLARDRFGICPLYWSLQTSREGKWLLFASEIKGLLASGLVRPTTDLRGIDQVFNFFAVPGPSTCFAGVQALQPGHFLNVDLGWNGPSPEPRPYWSMNFPDAGHELDGDDAAVLDHFERTLLTAVEHRLRADVPVVSYVSGGIDSSVVAAMAAKIRGNPTPVFTVQVQSRRFDESHHAAIVSRHIGAHSTVVEVGTDDVVRTYPELIRAAEAPVIDTAAAAVLILAREVHRQGFKVALAGEGSDEWLAGYPWHKVHRLIEFGDVLPALRVSPHVRRAVGGIMRVPPRGMRAILSWTSVLGHHSAFHDVYALMTGARSLLFSNDTWAALENHNPYLELKPDLSRLARWHSLNQSAYWAGRIHLPGHLLSLKGDRPAMNSSVETRYPFLDEQVFEHLAALHPRWKMRGLRDKYILRLIAQRYLPKQTAWRRKMMFRAPLDGFFSSGLRGTPPFVEQLLSEDALRRTGWFDVDQVQIWRTRINEGRVGWTQKTMVHLGMVGVLASQLWYHTFIEPLADVPGDPRSDAPHASGDSYARAAETPVPTTAPA